MTRSTPSLLAICVLMPREALIASMTCFLLRLVAISINPYPLDLFGLLDLSERQTPHSS